MRYSYNFWNKLENQTFQVPKNGGDSSSNMQTAASFLDSLAGVFMFFITVMLLVTTMFAYI